MYRNIRLRKMILISQKLSFRQNFVKRFLLFKKDWNLFGKIRFGIIYRIFNKKTKKILYRKIKKTNIMIIAKMHLIR